MELAPLSVASKYWVIKVLVEMIDWRKMYIRCSQDIRTVPLNGCSTLEEEREG
jgi:hypothetical protein